MNVDFQFPFQNEWFKQKDRVKVSEDNMFIDYHLFQVEAVLAVLGDSSVFYFSEVEQARKNFIYKVIVFSESIGVQWKWGRKDKSVRLGERFIKASSLTNQSLRSSMDYLIFDNPSLYERMSLKVLKQIDKTDYNYRFLGVSPEFLEKLSELNLISSRPSLLSSR